MKQTPEKEASQKKPYIAPKVMKVDLAAEEVMLGFCKTGPLITGGKTNSLCQLCAVSFGS